MGAWFAVAGRVCIPDRQERRRHRASIRNGHKERRARRAEPQPIIEFRPASPARNIANGDRDGLLLADENHELLAAGEAGVEYAPGLRPSITTTLSPRRADAGSSGERDDRCCFERREICALGIERAAAPSECFIVLLVLGIGEDLEQPLVARWALRARTNMP